MARTKKRTCSVTGMTTSERNFYGNQSHVKAVDNLIKHNYKECFHNYKHINNGRNN